MIGDPGGHRLPFELPSAFLRWLSQRTDADDENCTRIAPCPTEGIMPIRPTRKAQGFAPLSCVGIRSVRLNRSMALVLAFGIQTKSARGPICLCQRSVETS